MAKSKTTRPSSARRPPRKRGGGPTASGGYNYQAAVTAIALAYTGRGAPLGWLDGLADDTPREVACETGRGGDDIRLTLVNGDRVEIQVKKGLSAGAALTAALTDLAAALADGSAAFGVLAVCPFSSRTIAQGLAADIIRLGENSSAEVDPLAADFRDSLTLGGLDVAGVCKRLRILTVAALDGNGAHVAAARAELAHICGTPAQARSAWDALYRFASGMIASRGRRTVAGVAALLRSAGIDLSQVESNTTAILIDRLIRWTADTNDSFTILGLGQSLSIDDAWLPLTLRVTTETIPAATDTGTALEAYHGWSARPGAKGETCDADSVGRFFRQAVIIAGPGMGKSTLLRRLARNYALDGYPVLLVDAKRIAAAMQNGSSFESAAFELALDGSHLSPEVLRSAPIDDWVLLCDGLDEAGSSQPSVLRALRKFQQGRPGARIITSSRPIGYDPAPLESWRHYEIVRAPGGDSGRDLQRLLRQIGGQTVIHNLDDPDRMIRDRHIREALGQSPLMLGIAAALISRGHSIGHSRVDLFRHIFAMIQAEPPERAGPAPATAEVLDQVIDHLGALILDDPIQPKDGLVKLIGSQLAPALGLPLLRARSVTRACLDYWEAIGLVETVSHGTTVLLTMVHLSFAEFAAGRFIAGLPPADLDAAVALRAAEDRWTEGLWFAAAEGAGDKVVGGLVAAGIEGRNGEETLLRALDIVAAARTPLADELVERLFSAARSDMASDDVDLACGVAIRMLPLAGALADRVVPLATGLLNAGHPWSRLAGWSLVAEAGRVHYDLGAAQVSLSDFLEAHEVAQVRQGFGISNRPSEDDLMQAMALKIFEHILAERPMAEAEAFIGPRLHKRALNTGGFWSEVHGLLRASGSRLNPMADIAAKMPMNFSFKGFDTKAREVWRALLCGLVPSGLVLEPSDRARPGRSLYNLSAVSDLARWGDIVPKDVWGWSDKVDPRGTAATLGAVVRIAGLDPNAVGREALLIMAGLENAESEAFSAFFGRLTKVDIPPLETRAVDRSKLDVEGLKIALSHPSEMIVPVAATILDAFATVDERRALIPDLLASDSALQVWAGAAISAPLPRIEVIDLLLKRISEGAEGNFYRLRALTDLKAPCDTAVFAVIDPLLTSADVEDATEAARYLATAGPLDPNMVKRVRDAEQYWRLHEAPSPKEFGVVPASPRAELMRARIAQGDLAIDHLLDQLNDPRSDVRTLLVETLVERLGKSSSRAIFIDRVLSGLVPTARLATLFERATALTEPDLLRLEPLFTAHDAATRTVALAMLAHPSMDAARRNRLLVSLRGDVEPTIRTRAAALIKRFAGAGSNSPSDSGVSSRS